MGGLCLLILIPWIVPEDSSSRMSLDRTSEPRMKRREKRVPLHKTPAGAKLTKGEAVQQNGIGDWKEALVDPVDLCLVETKQRKKILRINDHSIWSKALVTSSLRPMNPPLPLFCFMT